MKSYASTSTDSEKPDGFLAYMVPSIDEVECFQNHGLIFVYINITFCQDYLIIISWLR